MNEMQKLRRRKNNNYSCKKYEKTKRGFVMRAYNNMIGRTEGRTKKSHLWAGKELIDRDTFYKWIFSKKKFHVLFSAWEMSGYNRKLTPSVDRIDSRKGYIIDNMRVVTFSENCSNIRSNK